MTDKKKGQAMANVSVIGAGSWGTALALLLCKNGHDVTVWSYKEEEVRTLSEKREQVRKLPGVKIPNEIFFTADLKEAVEGKDVVVLAVPSIHVRNTAKKMNAYVKGGQILVDVAKGIEEDTLMTLSQQIEEEIPQADVAVLSGPSHAEEVGRGLPTTVCIGAHTEATAKYLQQLWKKVRKQGGLCTGITQNIVDLLMSETSTTMLSNSAFILLLNQSSKDIEKIVEALEISEEQLNYVIDSPSGCGLIKCGSRMVPFDNVITKDSELYRLYNTNMYEKMERREKEKQ